MISAELISEDTEPAVGRQLDIIQAAAVVVDKCIRGQTGPVGGAAGPLSG